MDILTNDNPTQILESILLGLVALHAALHIKPSFVHALHWARRWLGVRDGERCRRRAAILLVLLMVASTSLSAAPAVYYGKTAFVVALGRGGDH